MRRNVPQKSWALYTWHSQKRKWGDKCLWIGWEPGQKIVRTFGQNDPLEFLPKFFQLYHSTSCGWNIKSFLSSSFWGLGGPKALFSSTKSFSPTLCQIVSPMISSFDQQPFSQGELDAQTRWRSKCPGKVSPTIDWVSSDVGKTMDLLWREVEDMIAPAFSDSSGNFSAIGPISEGSYRK